MSRFVARPYGSVRVKPYWADRGFVCAIFPDNLTYLESLSITQNNSPSSSFTGGVQGLFYDSALSQSSIVAHKSSHAILGPLSLCIGFVLPSFASAKLIVGKSIDNENWYYSPFNLGTNGSGTKISFGRSGNGGSRCWYQEGTASPTNALVQMVVTSNASSVAETSTSTTRFFKNGSKDTTDIDYVEGTGSFEDNGGTLNFAYRPVVGYTSVHIKYLYLFNKALLDEEARQLSANPWQLFAAPRRLWVQLGAASGGAGTDAAIAGTQDSDVGAITAEATTAAAIAGTQDADVGAIAAEATTGAAIAGAQAPDVGAITAEATTGAAIVGTQDSDVAALEVTAGTGSTDAAMAGTQAPDVGAITVEATLGLTLSATQASDVGYIVVEATLPASMAGTQDSDVAAITVTAAGTSIWTDISGSTTSWADQSAASTIWTDL